MRRARRLIAASLALIALPMSLTLAQSIGNTPRLTGPEPFVSEVPAPPIAQQMIGDTGFVRSYPQQPPTIPHQIDGYDITLNANRCLSCHAREATGRSGAPMVSVTHYQDRAGQTLARVAPRQYFCTQCHVTQSQARPLVANDFRYATELE